MIWAILALLGVPLWLCAMGILALVFRNRGLRRRPGNGEHRSALLGPFSAPVTEPVRPRLATGEV